MDLLKTIERKRVLPETCGELADKTVYINRVAKVVKGGRRFSFSALVVCGDGQGHVGFGLGKAKEVPEAIRKGVEQARQSLVKVPLRGQTVPHDIVATFGSARIVIKSAAPGTGVIAGSVARAVVETAGIKDIRVKVVRGKSAQNILQAVLSGLLSIREPESVARLRGKDLDQLPYAPY